MTICVLYARVSTKRQAEEGLSLDQQLDALREFAEHEGYEIAEVVRDAGVSGATLDRPGLWSVRERVAEGGIDALLVQDRDRLSREPAYTWLLRQEFEKSGCVIRTPNGHDDDDSPVGQLTSGILDQVAAFERRFTALRMRRGKLAAARKGRVIATNDPTYGFAYTPDRKGYVVDEETMRVVRRVYRMVAGGTTNYEVAETLEREGIPSPRRGKWGTSGKWSKTMVRNILTADAYKPFTYEEVCAEVTPEVASALDPDKRYGLWYFAGIPVPVPDAGVPREIVEMARERIKDNRVPSNAGRRFWTLSGGIARCPECGSAMEAHTVGGNGKRRTYFYYQCRTRYNNGSRDCAHNRSLRAEELEGETWEFVKGLMEEPQRLGRAFDRLIRDERSRLRGDPAEEARAWLGRLEELDAQRRRAQSLAVEGLLDPEDLRGQLARIDSQRETVQKELEDARSRSERIEGLERSRARLVDAWVSLGASVRDLIPPEQRHEFYKDMGLGVFKDGRTGETRFSWAFGGSDLCGLETPS